MKIDNMTHIAISVWAVILTCLIAKLFNCDIAQGDRIFMAVMVILLRWR